ncbi:MAG TPA: CRTAC1 family protein, partial [Candidatus Polarisedimenticolaceae bacterium]|nr:CRTAC1 family protein [Candidatus Polarisedimenticolaceae bacterium]
AVADYDGDGRSDILVTNFGPNVLYRNRGDGTFDNVAPGSPIEAPGWNTGAAFFDADADGDLDLYVAAYIDQTIDAVIAAERVLDWKGVDRVAIGPFGLPGAVDHFFLSDGAGRFVDSTTRAGLDDRAEAYGFAVRAADFDRDGDVDLYVANDSDANYLYRNEGDAIFTEVGLWSGAALDANGAAQAGMGIAVGDPTGDGVYDLFVTNFSEDYSTLYRGDGTGFFDDVSGPSGVGELTYDALSWGTVFADLDNDGDEDLVVANGHIYPQVDDHPQFGLSYEQRNSLLENLGDGRFVDATARGGPGFEQLYSSRGLAAGDYDNDGDLDLLITHLDRPPSLLRNDSTSGAWLIVDCRVPPGAGARTGTEVTVRFGGRIARRDLASGGSFLSVNDPRVHFGLGTHERVERLEIRWPDGTLDRLDDVAARRIVSVTKSAEGR